MSFDVRLKGDKRPRIRWAYTATSALTSDAPALEKTLFRMDSSHMVRHSNPKLKECLEQLKPLARGHNPGKDIEPESIPFRTPVPKSWIEGMAYRLEKVIKDAIRTGNYIVVD